MPLFLPTRHNAENLVCERYAVIRQVGSGAFSKVWKVRDVRSGVHVAIKTIERPPPNEPPLDAEKWNMLEQLSHRSIVALFGFKSFPGGAAVMVLELAPDGDLFDRLRDEQAT